ncbi:MAG: phosphoribulokinase [Synechococcus sp.]|nr:phosphoribulokinase [Synechococcus sp.]
MDPDGHRDVSPADQARLLGHLGISQPGDWETDWRRSGVIDATAACWPDAATSDWLWSLGLPLLSEVRRHLNERRLIGLSALPGCGKTSLGHWLEAAATHLGLALQVVSIDDFYFEAEELERSMAGNPWGVPRALPGSHDLELLNSTLADWKAGNPVELPRFDKALRGGRGDRCGWRPCSADVLILEGWFIGVTPEPDDLQLSEADDSVVPPLNSLECKARVGIQDVLGSYRSTWQQLDSLWQLRPQRWDSPELWKRQQEQQMMQSRGICLSQADLDGFIRMIAAAIPRESFNAIDADICIDVDPERRLGKLRIQAQDQDSLSSDSATG